MKTYEFFCHSCNKDFHTKLNHSSEVTACTHCGNSDDTEMSLKVSWDARYKTTHTGTSPKSEKDFMCNECHNEWSEPTRNFHRKKVCPRCGTRNTDRSLRKASFRTDVDWEFGKSADQIADCLVPDDNGRFKNPY